jgi:hypothetical protein
VIKNWIMVLEESKGRTQITQSSSRRRSFHVKVYGVLCAQMSVREERKDMDRGISIWNQELQVALPNISVVQLGSHKAQARL